MNKYKLKYWFKAEAGNFSTQDIEQEEYDGLTDALFFASILKGNGRNYCFFSMDGETDSQLTAIEIFKMWTSLAHELSVLLPIDWQKDICDEVVEKIRAKILNRENIDSN
ncbi:MAG: hypothetical protein ABIP54_02090 [Candidatus Andersenbacteria bacterium]